MTPPEAVSFDLARARAETPGCERVVHFNNAGASLMPTPVIEAIKAQLDRELMEGGYESAARMQAAHDEVYEDVARLLNADHTEIALVESATRAWQLAFHAIPFRAGDRILTTAGEYASNYMSFLRMAEERGVTVEPVPSDETGQVSLDALSSMLDSRVRLVSLVHVPSNGGLVNPAERVGELLRGSNAFYLLDACQSAGQLPLDVARIGCHMLSATGRKYLRGPRGTGFLYVRRDALETLRPPAVDLHGASWTGRDTYAWRSDARRFECWESSLALRLGLGAAVRYALDWGLEAIAERIEGLADTLREGLVARGACVHDLGARRCGLVTFTLVSRAPREIQQALAARGINVEVSSRASTRLDMEARGLTEVVRASVHYYNSEAEIQRLLGALEALA